VLNVVVEFSAKVSEVNEITPQSNYVSIFSDGKCQWNPRFELSATHCSVDVTWFPFDSQRCELVFESWLLYDGEINITTTNDNYVLSNYIPTDEWNLTCTYS